MEPAGSGRVERRLAAILAADVAGYSRLMGADEEGMLERLKVLRREFAPLPRHPYFAGAVALLIPNRIENIGTPVAPRASVVTYRDPVSKPHQESGICG